MPTNRVTGQRSSAHAADCYASRGSNGSRPKKDLQLDLLGNFVVCARTQTLAPLPKKARALLAYLAMHPDRPIPREKLATLFWEDSGRERARRSLRECLMDVKTALGCAAEVLDTSGQAVALRASRVDVDVEHFERLARADALEALEAAFALYRDELLSGLDIASESFTEWLSIERQRMSSLASDVGYRLAVARRQVDKLDAAIEAAERLVRLDPLREDAHRLLMELFNAAGNRNAALRQYARCREILKRELGVAPERTTAELAAAIGEERSNRSALAAESAQSDHRAAPRMPNRTAIVVLPFCNLADRDQRYFAEGISEELSIALGRVPWLFVIGSGSAPRHRGDDTDVRLIGAELGVRYALRGSVRRENDRVRIVAQLLHIPDGGQIWAERFEGSSRDLFAIQDRIVGQACAKLAPALQSVEIDLSRRKRDRNLSAYDLYLRALPRFRTSFKDNQDAVQMLTAAIELDPSYGSAYGLAARCYQFQRLFGWLAADDPILQEGVRLARLAVEIGRDDSEALWMAGIALAQLAGEIDHGRTLIERSLALNPNSASAWIASSFVCGEIGDTDTALAHFENAQRLNPLDSMHHFQWLAAGFAHFVAGRYMDAAEAIDRTLMASPTYVPAIRLKVSVCGLLGWREQSARWVQRLREAVPPASVSRLSTFWRRPLEHNPSVLAKLIEGARVAGLPE